MMDILEVYERPYNPNCPVVCFDEKNKQLLGKIREDLPVRPGKARRKDYEYKRNGTVNLFVSVEPKGKKRTIKVTKRRTKVDFAKEIKRLVTKTYKKAQRLIMVLDNLNTHREKAIREVLGEEAEKILKKIEFHYTPNHASWLNMAEIEISALTTQCLRQMIPTLQETQRQTAAWVKDRNQKEVGINWTFTRTKARQKFKLNTNQD
jgi:hypothetical protein